MRSVFFRMQNASVGLWQSGKTGITVSLMKRFFCFCPTGNAVDLMLIVNADFTVNQIVHVDFLFTGLQVITYRLIGSATHFQQIECVLCHVMNAYCQMYKSNRKKPSLSFIALSQNQRQS